MKASEFRKLIREEVKKVQETLVLEATLDPNKKIYWFEYYPHYSGKTLKAEAVLAGKTLLTLKKLYDADNEDAFDRVLKAATKNKTYYFTYEVFDEHWNKLLKALTSNKPYGSLAEEGSFAMSPNNMAEAKKIVKDIEAEQDGMDF